MKSALALRIAPGKCSRLERNLFTARLQIVLCACVQPPRVEIEDDDWYVLGFHPCGITRRGKQQELKEQVAVTGKEEKQRQPAQRVQEGEGGSSDDDDADGDEDCDGGYNECDDIGQKHAIKGCMHHRGWAPLQMLTISMLDLQPSPVLYTRQHLETIFCHRTKIAHGRVT